MLMLPQHETFEVVLHHRSNSHIPYMQTETKGVITTIDARSTWSNLTPKALIRKKKIRTQNASELSVTPTTPSPNMSAHPKRTLILPRTSPSNKSSRSHSGICASRLDFADRGTYLVDQMFYVPIMIVGVLVPRPHYHDRTVPQVKAAQVYLTCRVFPPHNVHLFLQYLNFQPPVVGAENSRSVCISQGKVLRAQCSTSFRSRSRLSDCGQALFVKRDHPPAELELFPRYSLDALFCTCVRVGFARPCRRPECLMIRYASVTACV